MLKHRELWVSISLLVFCSNVSIQQPASANPFDAINQALDRINTTVNKVDGTARSTTSTISSLNKLLGFSDTNESNGRTTTERILNIYSKWYKGLSPTDQEIVSWLVIEQAKDKSVTFETMSSSDWFLKKSLQEQQKAASLFFKLNEIVKATEGDKVRFLAFAFCVNSGTSNCAAQGL